MAQTTHEGGEQKSTNEAATQNETLTEPELITARRIGELSMVDATGDIAGLPLVQYLSDQAVSQVRALQLIKGAPWGSMEVMDAVIDNARLGRDLLIDPLPELGEQARMVAENAQELLRQYTLDVSREIYESGGRDDETKLAKLFTLLSELSYVDLESNQEVIVRAIRIVNGMDHSSSSDSLKKRIAGLEAAFDKMSRGLRHEPEAPGSW